MLVGKVELVESVQECEMAAGAGAIVCAANETRERKRERSDVSRAGIRPK